MKRIGVPRLTAGAIALTGLASAAALPPSLLQGGPVLCPFRFLTGLPCPGCGMTRSVVALLHGDLAASVFYHPLGVAVVAGAAIVAVLALIAVVAPRVGARAVPPPWLSTDALARGPLPWVGVVAFIALWLVRLPMYLNGAWAY
jgi:hypothetical protein